MNISNKQAIFYVKKEQNCCYVEDFTNMIGHNLAEVKY